MRGSIGAAVVALLAAVGASAQTPLGTSFTYQGQLRDGGPPAAGSYDFQFGLFGAASGGSAVAPLADRPGVAVASGLFTVSLDFGAAAFAGDARWLEIRVRPAGGTLYTILGTRQPLTAAPYALSAAGVVDGAIVDADVSAAANLSGAKLANASVTGAKIAGGAGSGVHADTLDDLNSSQLVRSDQDARIGGSLTLDASAAANAVYSETGITRTEMGVTTFTIANGSAGPADAAQVLLDAGNGSPAIPAYSFAGDTDTGVTRAVADRLDLVAGGSVIARASATGLIATVATSGGVAVRGDASAFAASDGVVGVAGSTLARGMVAQQTGAGPAIVASSASGDHLRASLSASQADFNPVLRVTNEGHVLSDGTFAFNVPVTTTYAEPAFSTIGDPASAADLGVVDANDLFVSGTLGVPQLRTATAIVGDASGQTVLSGERLSVGPGWGIHPSGADFPQLTFVDDETIRLGTDMFFKVGIRRTPQANALEVDGNASKTTAGGWLANSDRRLKTDVRDLDDPLAVVRALRPVSFRYSAEFLARHPGVHDVRYHNFVAQEFQQVFPDSVQDDGQGFLQMDSYPANVYAVGAIQQLERQFREAIAERDAHVAALEARLARMEAAMRAAR